MEVFAASTSMGTTTHALSESIFTSAANPLHQLLHDQLQILARIAAHCEQGLAPDDRL
jgi:hypothetical protein